MQANHRHVDRVLTFSCKQVHQVHNLDSTRLAVNVCAKVECIVASVMEFALIVKSKGGSNKSTSRRRSKISELTSRDLQLGIHENDDLRMMCDSIPTLSSIVAAYLDQETEQVFMKAGRVLTRPKSALIDRDGKLPTISNWRRHDDAAVTDSDFSRLLMRTHPAYTLSNDARLFLGSITRELILAILSESNSKISNTSLLVGGAVGAKANRYAKMAMDRFSLISPKGDNVRICFRAQDSTITTATCKLRAQRNSSLKTVLDRASTKLKVDCKNTTYIYNGRPLDPSTTPEKLGMDSTAQPVQIFAVPKQWWIFKQREQARRGLLTSLKSIDVKELVEQVKSKVDSITPSKMKNSTSSPIKTLSSISYHSKHIGNSNSNNNNNNGNEPASDDNPRFSTKLRKPHSYKKKTSHNSMPRLILSPKTGTRPDLSELDNIPIPQVESFTDSSERTLRRSPFRPVRHRRSRKHSTKHQNDEPSAKLRAEKIKELRRKGIAKAKEAKLRREKQRKEKAKQAAIKIQSKIRQRRDTLVVQSIREKKKNEYKELRNRKIRNFNVAGKKSLVESRRTIQAWGRVKRVFQDLPEWISNLETPSGTDEDEESTLCLEQAKKLRALIFDAEAQTELFQDTAKNTLAILEKWDQDHTLQQQQQQQSKHSTIYSQKKNATKLPDYSTVNMLVASDRTGETLSSSSDVITTSHGGFPHDSQFEEINDATHDLVEPRNQIVPPQRTARRRMKKQLATVEEEE
jgi:hypothetical protein